MTTFLKADDLSVIEKLAASDPNETIRKRVRLLLLYEAGMKTAEIAEKVKLSPGRVLYWRRRYLKDGLGVFGEAADDLEGGTADRRQDEEPRPSLAKLVRAVRKANKSDDSAEEAREALGAGIERAEKRRKKLRKRMRRAGKKKASQIRERLKRLDRRIRRAKKVQKKRK